MPKRFFLLAYIFLSVMTCASSFESQFQQPPRQAGIRCWWWWLNSNVTTEAITRDLEAMHDKGFSGALIFDASGAEQRGNRPVPPGPTFASKEWVRLFKHAVSEADRLDLELGLCIQSGWNLGGPNVTVEMAAKQLTWSEVEISGPLSCSKILPQPLTREGFYRDIAVLAFPIKEKTEPIRDLNLKASFQEVGWSVPDARFLLDDVPAVENEEAVTIDRMIDLTDKLSDNGRLIWDVPDGQWCILRFGYTYNNSRVSTQSEGWDGRVIDYLSAESTTRYLDEVVKPLLEAVEPAVGKTLKYLQTDSWECGGMNWTENFPLEFKQRRGYDPIPYLPVIAGKIVEDRKTSNYFLADFRKTISDCIAENHYQTFADFAHRYNMGIQPESGGPHAGPFDAMKNLGRSDIVMAEFWSPSPHRSADVDRFFVKQAASVAHIYGKKLVGAESFTTIGPHWNDVLWSQTRPSFNHEVCSGLNLVYLHTFTCSPKEMGLPGQEYFAGTHFNPQVTWWEYADGIIDYIARTQYLAQQGKFQADVLYYYGDHIPNLARLKEDDPAKVLPGYDYDVTNEEILLQLKVSDGRIIVPGSVSYRLLVLPDHKVLSLAALEKVDELLRQGAMVLGPKPERLVSLVGGQKAQTRFCELADAIWTVSPPAEGQNKIGSGTVFWGKPGRQVLQEMGVGSDFETEGKQAGVFDYIHYRIGDNDLYFICNLTDRTQETVCRFRVTNKTPQLWDPLTGKIQDTFTFAQSESQTSVPMRFHPYAGLFVVFKNERPASSSSKAANYIDYTPVQTLSGPWQVSFDPKWGGPATVTFQALTSWTQRSEPGIKFYSGKAIYKTAFDVDTVDSKKTYQLDLGEVADVGICRVVLNGEDVGIIWTKPFRADITNILKPGRNNLQVSVINSWRNRLIGDSKLPPERQLTKTNITVRDDWQLQDSGLLGPVQILCEQ